MLYSKLKLIHCQNLVQNLDQNDQGKALIEAHFQFKMLRYADNVDSKFEWDFYCFTKQNKKWFSVLKEHATKDYWQVWNKEQMH